MRLNRKIYWKIIASSFAFVGMAVAIAAYLRSAQEVRPRNPASGPAGDENGKTLFSNLGLSDLDEAFTKQEAGAASIYDPRQLPFHLVRKELGEWNEGKTEAQNQTGLSTKRARVVVFNAKALELARKEDRVVPLNLFDDTVLKVKFLPATAYSPNHSLYTGTVEGDPASRVHFSLVGGVLSGTVEAGAKQYRILSAGKKKQHYIIEIETKSPDAE